MVATGQGPYPKGRRPPKNPVAVGKGLTGRGKGGLRVTHRFTQGLGEAMQMASASIAGCDLSELNVVRKREP